MKKENSINIAMASDINQWKYMINTAYIVQSQTKKETYFFFFVFKNFYHTIKLFLKNHNVIKNYEIFVLENYYKNFNFLPKSNGYPLIVYYKIFCSKILEKIDKLIVMDNDIYVEGDINELWETKLPKNFEVAFAKRSSKYPNYLKKYALKNEISIKNNIYGNCGIIILNCDFVRKKEFSQYLFNNIEQIKKYLKLNEQDFFNLYFKISYFPKAYNISDDIDDINMENQNLKIFHFISYMKPWNSILKNKLIGNFPLELKYKYNYKINAHKNWLNYYDKLTKK